MSNMVINITDHGYADGRAISLSWLEGTYYVANKNDHAFMISTDVGGTDLVQYTRAPAAGQTVIPTDSNNGTYTIDGDPVFASGETTITVAETIPDDTVIDSGTLTDGGLYNLRRVVVSSAFLDADAAALAPAAGQPYIFGKTTTYKKRYTVIGIKPDEDQQVEISALEYNSNIYNYDADTPVLYAAGLSSPLSDDRISLPTLEDIRNEWRHDEMGPPVTDGPLLHNILWTDNDPAGSVSWGMADDVSASEETPIILHIDGTSYEITEGSSDKKYVYWDDDITGSFQDTDTLVTAEADGNWLIAVNDGGTLIAARGQTADLTVDTLQVRDNAINTVSTAFTEAALALTGAMSTIESVGITTSGNNVVLTFAFLIKGNVDWFDLQIKRDGDIIWGNTFYYASSAFCYQFVDTSPGTGAVTYYLQAKENTQDLTVEERSFAAIEAKR